MSQIPARRCVASRRRTAVDVNGRRGRRAAVRRRVGGLGVDLRGGRVGEEGGGGGDGMGICALALFDSCCCGKAKGEEEGRKGRKEGRAFRC